MQACAMAPEHSQGGAHASTHRSRHPYKVTGPERNVYMRQQALDIPRTLRRCADCVSMEHNVSASVCVVAKVCRVAPCLVRSERQASALKRTDGELLHLRYAGKMGQITFEDVRHVCRLIQSGSVPSWPSA